MANFRQVKTANGTVLHINPDHVMFVGQAVKDGAVVVNSTAVKLIDAMIIVEGTPQEVVVALTGEPVE